MVNDGPSHSIRIYGLLRHHAYGASSPQTLAFEQAGESRTNRLFILIHNQHCNLQCVFVRPSITCDY